MNEATTMQIRQHMQGQ